MLKNLLVSMRPRQWYKNILLFVSIIFAGELLNTGMWATLVLAFIYFCMITGGEYIINDIFDRKNDREHPSKSQRPIASGKLKLSYAFLFVLPLIVIALLGAYFTINVNFLLISISYLVLVLLYTLILKHHVIVDVVAIALGFVVRVVASCLAVDVFISPWLIICTFLLALFLALEKRWCELVIMPDNAEAHRPTLSEYSTKLLEQLITITAGATIVSYLIYTTLTESNIMVWTSPLVIYTLFRYIYLVHEKGIDSEPVVMFRDKSLLASLGIWGLLVVAISLYGII